MPFRNAADLEDVPKDVLAELKINLVKNISEVLPIVLEPPGAEAAPNSQGEPPTAPSQPPVV